MDSIRSRPFPLLLDYRQRKAGHATHIPWALAERAYRAYVAKYGQGQSLERIAERGGLGPEELDVLAPGWRAEVP